MRRTISPLTSPSTQGLVPPPAKMIQRSPSHHRSGTAIRRLTRIHASDGVQLVGGYRWTEKHCKRLIIRSSRIRSSAKKMNYGRALFGTIQKGLLFVAEG